MIADRIVDFVYPPRCATCGRRGVWVCVDCSRTAIPNPPPWCVRCGESLAIGDCRCRTVPVPIDSIRFPFHLEGWVRDAIYRLKYDGEIARARHLAPALTACLPDLRTLDAIVPVPLHRRRLRERGFNQAMELALVVGKLAHVPVIDVLRRDRYTDHQTRLSADSRRANVSGAFSLTSSMPVSGTRLLLLDDVLTTGSTSAACARALRGGGAVEVSVLTLAREH